MSYQKSVTFFDIFLLDGNFVNTELSEDAVRVASLCLLDCIFCLEQGVLYVERQYRKTISIWTLFPIGAVCPSWCILVSTKVGTTDTLCTSVPLYSSILAHLFNYFVCAYLLWPTRFF